MLKRTIRMHFAPTLCVRAAKAAKTGSTRDILKAIQSDMANFKTDMATIKTDVANVKSDMANVKSDMANVKSDIANVKSDMAKNMATIKTDLATIKTDLANVKSDMAKNMATIKTDLATINSRLDVVMSGEPWEADMRSKLKASVAPCIDVINAIRTGETATWTLISVGSVYYAVGALHCALFYGCQVGAEARFVSVHQSVLDCGVRGIGFVKSGPGGMSTAGDTSRDLVLIALVHPPPTGAWKVEQVVSPDEHHMTVFDIIFGMSNSGDVTGEGNFVVTKDPEKSSRHGVFVENSGEPGHSGTLLLGFQRGKRGTVLSTYFGLDDRSLAQGLRHRAAVALFPEGPQQYL
jgi:hypothetical protein